MKMGRKIIAGIYRPLKGERLESASLTFEPSANLLAELLIDIQCFKFEYPHNIQALLSICLGG